MRGGIQSRELHQMQRKRVGTNLSGLTADRFLRVASDHEFQEDGCTVQTCRARTARRGLFETLPAELYAP